MFSVSWTFALMLFCVVKMWVGSVFLVHTVDSIPSAKNESMYTGLWSRFQGRAWRCPQSIRGSGERRDLRQPGPGWALAGNSFWRILKATGRSCLVNLLQSCSHKARSITYYRQNKNTTNNNTQVNTNTNTVIE